MRRLLIRGYRLCALALAAWLICLANQRFPTANTATDISLDEARRIFPAAAALGPQDPHRKAQPVRAADGSELGWVLKTSPDTDDLIGYAGPSDLLVGVGPDGRTVRVELLWSKDTVVHVNAIRRDTRFWNQFTNWKAGEPTPRVDAVSGSTLTSLAMAEAVQRRLGGEALSLRFSTPITLEEVRAIFSDAAGLRANDPRRGWQRVLDKSNHTLGFAIRSSPQSDNVIGYQGPTDVLLAIAPDEQSVTAVRLRASYDTPEYVERVRNETDYLRQLAGRTLADWASMDFRSAGIEGVSGATQTSFAVAESIRRRAVADERSAKATPSTRRFSLRDAALIAIVIGALAISTTRLRGNRRVRIAWQAVLIAGYGLWLGDLLSLALFSGWSRSGLPWKTAPGLIALTAVSLLVPWGTRQQIYCHHMCPHGAAQEWLGRFRRGHVHLPRWIARALGFIPAVLLASAFVLATTAAQFDLSLLEPFDAWAMKAAAMVPLAIAIIGLVSSLLVPMAYCRFGCPTGALLKFARSHGTNERFGSQDWFAAALLLAGAGCVLLPPTYSGRQNIVAKASEPPVLSGNAFGTTWSVKWRAGSISDRSFHDLDKQLAAELERVESRLSHWRPGSETSQFNSSATTLEMECDPDLVFLVDFAMKLSRATDGAFDITVGPLVNAWGYGPGKSETPPSNEEIEKLLESTGWQKIEIDRQSNSLRKRNPDVQIDLGALLQGYAADRIAERLNAAGITEYLIDVGGELRCRGEWNVAIENPREPSRPLVTVALKDAALATSGTYRKSPNGEAQTRHIISPKTGRPMDSTWQLCAVIDRTGLEADGWATALLASDPEEVLAIAERERIAALFVGNAGNVVTTSSFRAPVTSE